MCGPSRNFYVSGTPVRIMSFGMATQEDLCYGHKDKKAIKVCMPLTMDGAQWIRTASKAENLILSYDFGYNQVRTFHGVEILEFKILARPKDRMEVEFLFSYHHTEDGCSHPCPTQDLSPTRVMTWDNWDEFIAKIGRASCRERV